MKKAFLPLMLLLSGSLASAQTPPAGPSSFTYEGRVYETSGSPSAATVSFIVRLLNPAGTCIIYEEAIGPKNLADTNGYFSVSLGEGTRAAPNAASPISDLVSNAAAISGVKASDGTACSYTPVTGDSRKMRIIVDEAGTQTALTPDISLGSSPYAMIADSLRGMTPSQFLQTNANTTQTKIDSLTTSANWAELQSLLAGTSARYLTSTSGTVSSSVTFSSTVTLNATPVNPHDAVNKNYCDTSIGGKVASGLTSLSAGDNGKVLQWDGSQWIASAPGGGGSPSGVAGGDLTSTYPNPTVARIRTMAVSPTTPTGPGQVLRYDGSTQYAPAYLTLSDIHSSVTPATSVLSGGACTTGQALIWQSASDTLVCSTLSIPAAQVTGLGSAANMNAGTAPSNLVQLDGTGALPSLDAFNLYNINAGSITSGTISAARLPANILVAGGNALAGPISIGTNDSFGVDFRTNNTSRMMIDLAGNVGIGTMTPSAKLQIDKTSAGPHLILRDLVNPYSSNTFNSYIMAQDNSSVSTWVLGDRDTSNNILEFGGLTGNHAVALTTNNVPRMLIAPTGEIGIGTMNPPAGTKLAIEDADQSTTMSLTNTTSSSARRPVFKINNYQGGSTGGFGVLRFNNSHGSSGAPANTQTGDVLGQIEAGGWDGGILNLGATIKFTAVENWNGTALGTNIVFSTTPSTTANLTPAMTIDHSGNVGVGVSSPMARIDSRLAMVNPPSTFTGIQSLVQPTFSISNSQPVTAVAGIAEPHTSGGNSTGFITGVYGQATIVDSSVSINNMVGVKSTYGIQGNGSVTNAYGFYAYPDRTGGSVANSYGLYIAAPAGSGTITNEYGVFQASPAARNVFQGYVGIGTTSPVALLHVNGAAQATAWNVASDKRLKHDVREIENPLAKILQLRGVHFKWNKDQSFIKPEREDDIGVIAQEVEAVFPEAVTTTATENKYKTVAYSKLVSPLIGATKELYGMCKATDDQVREHARKIASLEQENAALKAKLSETDAKFADLQKRLEALESRLGSH